MLGTNGDGFFSLNKTEERERWWGEKGRLSLVRILWHAPMTKVVRRFLSVSYKNGLNTCNRA